MQLYAAFWLYIVGSKEGAEFHTWNVTLGKPAVQSSVTLGGTADRAVDGNLDNNFSRDSCIHTLHGEVDQWWMVDLQGVYNITDVWIQNRGDMDGFKFHDFVVEVYMRNPVVCGKMGSVLCNSHPGEADLGERVHLPCLTETIGRYVKLLKLPENITDPQHDKLIVCEVEVHGSFLHQCQEEDIEFLQSKGKKIPSNNTITEGVSRPYCSRLCYIHNSCYGINYQSSRGGCQLFTELLPNLSQTADSNWDFYTRC